MKTWMIRCDSLQDMGFWKRRFSKTMCSSGVSKYMFFRNPGSRKTIYWMVDLVRLWWMTPTQTMHYHGEYVTLESPTTISYRLVSEFHHYFSRDSCSTIPGGLFFEWSAWLPGFLVQSRWWFQTLFFHPYDLVKIPIWLMVFRWVETTNH